MLVNEINFGSRTINFSVKRKERKTLNIRVHPNSNVEVIAPIHCTDEQVFEKIRLKAAWVIKQQDFFFSYLPHTPIRRYISGESHRYLGRQYRLRIMESDSETIKLSQGQLIVSTPLLSTSNIEKKMNLWYEQKTQIVFNEIFEKSLVLFSRYTFPSPTLHVRRMEKRWGSCTQKGKITLNTELIKASKACIEYVVIHELCHLVHFNHKKEFYQLLSRILPDWEKRKATLEKMMV